MHKTMTAALAMMLVLGQVMTTARAGTYDAQRLPAGLHGPAPAIAMQYGTTLSDTRIKLTLDYLRFHNARLYAERIRQPGIAAISFDPQIVVVHYTVIPTLDQTVSYFAREEIEAGRTEISGNGRLNVGIHFVVDRDGSIYSLYPETVMARHVIGLNHLAIGIENIGDGDLDSNVTVPLTLAQVDSNVALIKYLAGKYPNLRWAIGHQEYRDLEDPAHPAHVLFVEDMPDYRTKKTDPGDRFLAAVRLGLAQ